MTKSAVQMCRLYIDGAIRFNATEYKLTSVVGDVYHVEYSVQMYYMVGSVWKYIIWKGYDALEAQ